MTLIIGRESNWADGKFQSLGIKLSVQKFEITDPNYLERLNNVTILGRDLIEKSVAIPRLIYHLSMLPVPDTNFMNTVNRKLYKFIWNNKNDKIKRKVMNQDFDIGGCKKIDINLQNKCLKFD